MKVVLEQLTTVQGLRTQLGGIRSVSGAGRFLCVIIGCSRLLQGRSSSGSARTEAGATAEAGFAVLSKPIALTISENSNNTVYVIGGGSPRRRLGPRR